MQAWRLATLLKRESGTGIFLWILRTPFLHNTSNGCFWMFRINHYLQQFSKYFLTFFDNFTSFGWNFVNIFCSSYEFFIYSHVKQGYSYSAKGEGVKSPQLKFSDFQSVFVSCVLWRKNRTKACSLTKTKAKFPAKMLKYDVSKKNFTWSSKYFFVFVKVFKLLSMCAKFQFNSSSLSEKK